MEKPSVRGDPFGIASRCLFRNEPAHPSRQSGRRDKSFRFHSGERSKRFSGGMGGGDSGRSRILSAGSCYDPAAQRLPLFRGSVPISPSMRSMGWAVWIRSTFSSGSTSITTRFRSIASPLRSAGETLLPFHFFPRSNCGPTSWGTSPFTDPWDLGSTSTVFPTVPR